MNNLSYEQEEETAVWRRDPVSSFSDWTIKVVRNDDWRSDDGDSHAGCQDTNTNNHRALLHDSNRTNPQSPSMSITESFYNVHKVYLASGPRKSEYFQTLFSLNTDTQESLSQMTTLVLPGSACLAFPRFLDFMYNATNGRRNSGRISWEQGEEEEDVYSSLIANESGDDSVDDDIFSDCGVDSDDVIRQEVALAYLADYLQVPALASCIRERIQQLLQKSKIHIFCREALVYSIDWIVQECIEVASESPRDLLPASDPQSGSLRHNAEKYPSLFDAQERSNLLVPPALQTLWMLPAERQVDLFRLALSKTLRHPMRFQPTEDDEYNYQFRT